MTTAIACVICRQRCLGDGADDPCGADCHDGSDGDRLAHTEDSDRPISGRSRRGQYVCGTCCVYDDDYYDA